jgi:hypothetical protein
MAVSHGKHLLSGVEEPLGEGGLLVRWDSHGPILDYIPGEGMGTTPLADLLQHPGAAAVVAVDLSSAGQGGYRHHVLKRSRTWAEASAHHPQTGCIAWRVVAQSGDEHGISTPERGTPTVAHAWDRQRVPGGSAAASYCRKSAGAGTATHLHAAANVTRTGLRLCRHGMW